MKIVGFCFFFLFNFSLCAQQDSGYVAHQFYMEYESLKEIGRYEKAAIALGKAFEYRGLTYLEYRKNSELKKISELVKNELSDSIKYANRIEWSKNALDSAAHYNWNTREQYKKSCYISSADYFYKEAQVLLAKPHDIQKDIHSEIHSLPVDTIYSNNPLSVFVVSIASAYKFGNPHNHLYQITKNDTLFTVRDSSLYSGIFVNSIHPINHSYNYFTQNYWQVERGLVVDQTTYSYRRDLIFDKEGNSALQLYINKISKEKSEETIVLNYRGDTTFYARKFIQNNVIIEDNVKYSIPRDTVNYSRTEFFPDSIVSFSYRIGDDNDTLEYNFEINKKKEGLQWFTTYDYQNQPSLETIRIITEWKNDTLIDILNERIIFMNNDNKIITKQEFIKKMEYRRNFHVIYDLIPNELLEGQDLNIIIYESKRLLEMYGTKEHEKRVRKILKEYKKAQQ